LSGKGRERGLQTRPPRASRLKGKGGRGTKVAIHKGEGGKGGYLQPHLVSDKRQRKGRKKRLGIGEAKRKRGEGEKGGTARTVTIGEGKRVRFPTEKKGKKRKESWAFSMRGTGRGEEREGKSLIDLLDWGEGGGEKGEGSKGGIRSFSLWT